MAKNIFNTVKVKKPSKNSFDLSHDLKMSANFGNLYPTLVQECVPGDRFNIGCEALVRLAPMIAPVMHRMNVTMHYWFVPNRILWPGWEDFITGGQDPNLVPAAPVLEVDTATYDAYPLLDYMGCPRPGDGVTYAANAIPFAAYQAIYNEWYRDQNLIDPVDPTLVDGTQAGPDAARLYQLRKRAWEHDYFTSALPFAQKGASVDIPLGNVVLNDDYEDKPFAFFRYGAGSDQIAQGDVNQVGDTEDNARIQVGPPGSEQNSWYDPNGSLEVQPTSINELRRAFRLQEWLEKNARAGSRYSEAILAHFGVRSQDSRLQRPEYITGSKSPIVISEVLNTTGEDGGLPQGNMAGHGISTPSGKYGTYFCQEHGFIIGVMSITPRTAYQQGLPRHFSRTDRFEYFWPEFAHIGEQEVLNKELYIDHPQPNGTFGYNPRYSEYKYSPSRVAGEFKTNLDFWHLGRIFSEAPGLNQTFVECSPSNRIFAVEGPVDHFYCHIYHKIRALRPMPIFGTPTI